MKLKDLLTEKYEIDQSKIEPGLYYTAWGKDKKLIVSKSFNGNWWEIGFRDNGEVEGVGTTPESFVLNGKELKLTKSLAKKMIKGINYELKHGDDGLFKHNFSVSKDAINLLKRV